VCVCVYVCVVCVCVCMHVGVSVGVGGGVRALLRYTTWHKWTPLYEPSLAEK